MSANLSLNGCQHAAAGRSGRAICVWPRRYRRRGKNEAAFSKVCCFSGRSDNLRLDTRSIILPSVAARCVSTVSEFGELTWPEHWIISSYCTVESKSPPSATVARALAHACVSESFCSTCGHLDSGSASIWQEFICGSIDQIRVRNFPNYLSGPLKLQFFPRTPNQHSGYITNNV